MNFKTELLTSTSALKDGLIKMHVLNYIIENVSILTENACFKFLTSQ